MQMVKIKAMVVDNLIAIVIVNAMMLVDRAGHLGEFCLKVSNLPIF